MSIEDRIQPVVTVAAFDPMTDKVLVQSTGNNRYTLPQLTPHNYAGVVDPQLLEQIHRELGLIGRSMCHLEGIIRQTTRETAIDLLDFRVVGVAETLQGTTVEATTFEDLNYVPGIREFLRRLFAEQKRTGTLLSTLKQPIYIRPLFFDYEGEQIIVPMETGKGGRPQTFVRDEHLHVNEIIGRAVHTYINPKATTATTLRLRAEPKQLLWKDTTTPIWQMDYGIAITPHTAEMLQKRHKTVAIPASPVRALGIKPSLSYNAAARQMLMDIKHHAAPFLLNGTTPTRIYLDRERPQRPRIT